MYAVRGRLNSQERKILMKFILKYRHDIPIWNVQLIYDMKQTVGVQFDEEGRIIPGTGREITLEDKNYIIEYLRNNNIPLTNAAYNAAVKRLVLGVLVIENNTIKEKSSQKVRVKKKIK